jgi:lipopolysaccharide transport system ATP-binding protein
LFSKDNFLTGNRWKIDQLLQIYWELQTEKMPDFILRAEGLGKKYTIGHQTEHEGYTALRDVMVHHVGSFWRKTKDFVQGRPIILGDEFEEVWALRDVSFEIQSGEVVGIIGPNGAGKSTLLKVLSRITEPSAGRIEIKGRVASLLEVGTGFHPELTGKENIYLNGAILGMTRAEIKMKFDEIVAFAEVERFLDTPVKRYSSGMYVRLAFAVAAHLDPEILVVDEVLAVGDYKFQKKCLGKMKEVSQGEGRTVLFVSHNMASISSLCSRCILLEDGMVASLGETADVILEYQTQGNSGFSFVDFSEKGIGDENAILVSGAVKSRQDHFVHEIDIDDSFFVEMRFKILKYSDTKFLPSFHFVTAEGICAFAAYYDEPKNLAPGEYTAKCQVPGNFLNDNTYMIGLSLTAFGSGISLPFHEPNVLHIIIKDPIEGIPIRNNEFVGKIPGVIRPQLEWDIEYLR